MFSVRRFWYMEVDNISFSVVKVEKLSSIYNYIFFFEIKVIYKESNFLMDWFI